ncbi:MAG: hypothetical protein NT090_03960 [Acidobacteria bacterium]|nr:hypothetical protein [Acidobacteriota bacterium]
MKKSGYGEEQVTGAVKRMETGRKAREIARELGVGEELRWALTPLRSAKD